MSHGKEANTRLDRSNEIGDAIEEATREVKRWGRGEVDMVTLIRTPKGEKIVDSYKRDNETRDSTGT